ncbi:MAG: mechanosensitive ion channel [bacterium]|nr:mechanosensitive ion channel [bacterium]
MEFSRCYFKTYGDFSLNYEVVYFVNSSSYVDYMNVNQEINLDIYKAFESEKIDFAFPTQTIHIEK